MVGHSPADIAKALDRGLRDDSQTAKSGRIFVPADGLSVRSVLASVAPTDDEAQAAFDAAFEDEAPAQILFRIARISNVQRVVWCSVSDSMVSGSWGLVEFKLGVRGYVYYQPDSGVGDDESLPVLGAWEPVEDRSAREECLLRIYMRKWSTFGLPPLMGQWATGDAYVLQHGVLGALHDEPDAWSSIFERLLAQRADLLNLPTSVVRNIAAHSGAPRARVLAWMQAFATRDESAIAQVGDRVEQAIPRLPFSCTASLTTLFCERAGDAVAAAEQYLPLRSHIGYLRKLRRRDAVRYSRRLG